MERARGHRLELWIGALIADMRKYEGLIQQEKDRLKALKAEKKREDAEHKYQVCVCMLPTRQLCVVPRDLRPATFIHSGHIFSHKTPPATVIANAQPDSTST